MPAPLLLVLCHVRILGGAELPSSCDITLCTGSKDKKKANGVIGGSIRDSDGVLVLLHATGNSVVI